MKKIVITGVTGQDGAYLVQLLLAKGHKVIGAYRRVSSVSFWRLEELGVLGHENLELHALDLTDLSGMIRLLTKHEPDEVYNLAAQSFVAVSFEQPITTAEITGIGALNLLEAIRIVNPKIRFYQASTSEMFGMVQEIPQNESTPFYPRSPYGVSKLFAHWSAINYRESYGIFAACGILFNHESPLRGKEFVTRKITNSVARIHSGLQDYIELGNLDAKRDWGYAPEYVEGMYKMLQIAEPSTFVLATSHIITVRDFVTLCFKVIGVDLEWCGKGESECGVDIRTGVKRVQINPTFYRPAEVNLLIGDPSKAHKLLDWQAQTNIEQLSRIMVEADIKRIQNEFPW